MRHPHFSLFHHVPFSTRTFRASLLGLCLAAVGCGDGADNVVEQPPILPSVSNVSVGDPTCPTGGVRVQVGADTNLDGDLDDDEVEQTSYVCNGTDMVGGEDDVLVRTVNLDPGIECVAGGRRLDIGLDNGDGTGIQGNDVLEDEEVDTSFLDCNGTMMVVVTPPTGNAGTFVFDTHGGSATGGTGGAAGSLRDDADTEFVNSYLMLASTGTVDATCTVPTVTLDLGDVPAAFAATTTVAIVAAADEAALPDGTVFGRTGDTGLYVWDATDMVANRATGLSVAAGATVTLPINNAYTPEGVGLFFDRDVDIAGTLTTTASASTRGHLEIGGRQVRLGAGSTLQTGGAADQNSGYVSVSAGQDLIALGAISTVGSAGASGRSGGSVRLAADGAVYAGGTINTSGGAATGGTGGDGGNVSLEGETRIICNSADITADGGAADGDAGDGGDIHFGEDCLYGIPLEIRNSGDLRTRGGSEAGTCDATCSGGEGGRIDFVAALSGGISSSGSHDTRGGNSANGQGGAGGVLNFRQGFTFEDTRGVARYEITGAVTTFGGDGATGGGHGGDVYTANHGAIGSATRFLGYASALMDGGDGTDAGGDAGSIVLSPEASETDGGLGFFVHTNVSAAGGTGGTGRGGNGGRIEFGPDIFNEVGVSGAPLQNFVVEGTINLSGGDGAQAGSGGSIVANSGCSPDPAVTGIEVAGTFTLDGGDASQSGGGTAGGLYLITARGTATVSGTISARGGVGAMGDGGYFPGSIVFGVPATVSAAFTAAGGMGSTTGGDTEDIAILSAGTSTVTGTVTVTAGAGPTAQTAGTQGSVRIDSGSTCVGPT
jgi:hypothetical protein